MVSKYDDLLESFKTNYYEDDLYNRGKTIFEISGYPHYENVASNILAFLLDSDEEHQMNEMWLEALLECYENKCKSEKSVNNYTCHAQSELVKVNREVKTTNGKFIDLVIELDKLVICIENKIYASADYNDFESYRKYVVKQYKDKDHIFILLSIDRRGDKDKFVNILYTEWFDKLPEMNMEGKWRFFVEDFMSNILSMTNKLDKDIYGLVKNDDKGVICQLLKQLEKQFLFKHDYLQVVLGKINKCGGCSFKFYGRNRFNGHQSLYKDYYEKDYIVTYEVFFMNSPMDEKYKNCLYHSLWIRNADNRNEIGRIRDWFKQEYSYSIEDFDSSEWGSFFSLYSDDFDDEDKTIAKMNEIHLRIIDGIQHNWKR